MWERLSRRESLTPILNSGANKKQGKHTMTKCASVGFAAMVALVVMGAAEPGVAAPVLFGAYVSGNIENTGCPVGTNGGNCLFNGTIPSPIPSPAGITSASGNLADDFASISGSGALATASLSVSVAVNGAPFCRPTGCGNPADARAVIFDTLTFHFSGPSALATIHLTGSGSASGDAGVNYGIALQSGGPIVPFFFAGNPVTLIGGAFDISQTFSVLPEVAYELDAGLRVTAASSSFRIGNASLDGVVTIELPEGVRFDSASGVLPGQTQVPEPSTLLLLGSGLAALIGFGRKRFCCLK